jgi:hypothetical protein
MSPGDPSRVRDYLEHIAEAITNIRDYTAGTEGAATDADLPLLNQAVLASPNWLAAG